MKKFFLFLFLFVAVAALNAQVCYTKADSVRVVQLLNMGRTLSPQANAVLFYARQFINTPYVAHTLEVNDEERLVVNVLEVDCTTFVEYVLALVQCVENKQFTFQAFCDYLAKIRYINGKIHYTKRQHYFTLWMNENEKDGFIQNVSSPNPPYSAVQTVKVNYMTQHVALYKMLNANKEWLPQVRNMEQSINGEKYTYIPKNQLLNNKTLRSTVKSGDIISIITSKNGLDTSHIGFAVWHEDGLHMLHASSIKKKVIEDAQLLRTYMYAHKTHLGIRTAHVL